MKIRTGRLGGSYPFGKTFLAVFGFAAGLALIDATVWAEGIEDMLGQPARVSRVADHLMSKPTRERFVAKAPRPFTVYVDGGSPANFFAPSGWLGDAGDLQLSLNSTEAAHSGKTGIRVEYTATENIQRAGWAGVYWIKNPPRFAAYGTGGYNLTGATKLAFWARGGSGNERVDVFRVGDRAAWGKVMDSDSAELGPVYLTPDWKRYEIDLEGKNLSSISSGFMFIISSRSNSGGIVIHLDDIRFE